MPGTYHKSPKGGVKYGVPVKSATGKKIGDVQKRMPSMKVIEDRKRKNRQALARARKHNKR